MGLAALAAGLGMAAHAQVPFPGYQKASVIERRDPPPEGIVVVRAQQQEREGSRYRLRGNAEIETHDMLLRAEAIDYDQETGAAEARGRVRYINFTSGEQLGADRIEYNLNDSSGSFYAVRGAAYGKINYWPGILRTENPFFL